MRSRKLSWMGLVFTLALVVTSLLLAGCAGGDEGASAATDAVTDPTDPDILSFSIMEPAYIDPVNAQESEGIQVVNAVFDSLVSFDYKTQELVPAAAESWESNEDATVWTFHLRDATFHDGSPVEAADFKYAWERICDPVNESEISYHLAPITGYDAMQEGSATELEGVKVIDEKTLEVTLKYSFGDFEYVVGHPALAPVPRAEVEKDLAAFAEMPIGNGPFKMAGPWQHDQVIQVVRFDDYPGSKAQIDGVDFRITKDADTAFLEFRAGNLDFAVIPSGQVKAVEQEFGTSPDGLEVSPGKQVLTGPETSIYYLVLNIEDEALANPDVRRALSLAINREAIATTVFEGIRKAATGIVPEGVAGYKDGQFPYSKYDVEDAKKLLEEAGYPGGQGLPEIRIVFNSGAGHEDVMAVVQADWKAIGVNTKLEGVEGGQWLEELYGGSFMISRLTWSADYPIIDNFLYPLFASASDDNLSHYQNPAVDEGLLEARSTVDLEARIEKYQEVEKLIGEDAVVIPIVDYRHRHIGSDRITGLVFSPLGLASLESVRITKAAE